jgi:hypothetical protein
LNTNRDLFADAADHRQTAAVPVDARGRGKEVGAQKRLLRSRLAEGAQAPEEMTGRCWIYAKLFGWSDEITMSVTIHPEPGGFGRIATSFLEDRDPHL